MEYYSKDFGWNVLKFNPAVYAKSEDQCRSCAFNTMDGDDCPQDGDGERYCDAPDKLNHNWVKIKSESNMYNDDFEKEIDQSYDEVETEQVGVKHDSGKPMYNLLPADSLEEVVKVLTVGAVRYNEPIDQENWRMVPNAQSRYFAAAQRHQWADQRGEFIDADTENSKGTGCYHLACAITSLMFKLQLRIEAEKNKQ